MPLTGSLADYSSSLKREPKAEERVPVDTVEVLDNATNKTQWLAPDEAQQKFETGEINLEGVNDLSVVMPDGTTGKVAPANISQALADGAHLISDAQEHTTALQKEYGGAKGGLISAGSGLARGATFGVSDELGKLIAGPGREDDYVDAVNASNEAHPWLKTGGEIGGMALGAVVTGGGSLAGGASALASGAVERGLARTGVAALEGGFAGRALAKGVGAAVQGGIEGGEIGLQQTLAEHALHEDGNVDLTGEKIIAGMGHGAFLGALAGGITGVAVEGLSTGAKIIGKSVTGGALERAANREMWRDLNSSKAISKKVAQRVEGGAEAIGAEGRAIGLDDPRLSIDQQADVAAKKLDEVGGALGDMYRQSGAKGTAKPLFDEFNGIIDELKTHAFTEGVVTKLESDRDSLARTIFKGLEPGETFMSPQEEQMAALEKELIDNGAAEHRILEVRAVRSEMASKRSADAREAGENAITEQEIPLETLWGYRKDLDAKLKWDGKDPAMGSALEKLREFRAKFSDHLEEVGSKVNPEFSTQIRSLNKQYQRLSFINDTLDEKVTRALTNRRESLTDAIAGGGGHSAAGSLLAAGHPLAAAASLGAGFVHKIVREKGPRVAAFVLGRVGGLDEIAGHIGAVDLDIQKAVSAFANRPDRTAGVLPRVEATAKSAVERHADNEAVHDRFMVQSAAVRNAAQHPELGNAIDSQLADVSQHAPEAATAAAATAKKAIAYLAKELPPQMKLDPLRPELVAPPSHAEMDRWLRKDYALNDPSTVFHALAHGNVDAVAVAALKAVMPALYAKFQQSALAEVAGNDRNLGHQERLQMATVLDTPTTLSLQPQGIAMRQETFSKPQGQTPGAGGGGSPSKSKGKPILKAASTGTPAQQLEKGD